MPSVDWDLYIKLLNTGDTGKTDRGDAINSALELFYSGIISDPSYHDDSVVNHETQPLAVNRKSALEGEITAMPGQTVSIGDMVYVLDEYWLVTNVYTDDIGLTHGTIWLCNQILSFQNHSPAIFRYSCIVDNGTYSKSGLDNDVSVLSNTYKIYITLDDNTKYLFVDKRLCIGTIYDKDGLPILEVYKIIGIDLKSKNIGTGSHIMVITVLRDVYNSEIDSAQFEICDFIKPSEDEQERTPEGTCAISGQDQIRIGTTRKYVAKFWSNGEEISSRITPVWTVDVPSGITYTISNGGECKITVPLDTNLIGESINLSITDSEGIYGNYNKEVTVVTIG